MKLRILRAVGLGLAWLLLVVYFVYLRFPYERVRPKLEGQIARVAPADISFDRVGPDGLGGLRLTGVTVQTRPGRRGGEVLRYELDRVDARLHLLSALRGRPGARIHVEGYGGSLGGTIARPSDTEVNLDLDVDGVELTGIPMPDAGGLEGRLDARLDDLVVVPGQGLQGLNGRIEIEASEGAVLPFKTRTTRIPPQPVRFDRLALAADLEAGQATVETLELEGPDVSASGTAEITLSSNIGRSPVNGELRVRFGPDFAVYEDVVTGLTRARKDSEGYLTLKLKGTLGRPM